MEFLKCSKNPDLFFSTLLSHQDLMESYFGLNSVHITLAASQAVLREALKSKSLQSGF